MKQLLISALFLFLSATAFADNSNKIIVYSNPGCSRCAATVKYLTKNSIPFTEYSIADKKYNAEMWKAVSETGKFKGRSIGLPVVSINGETFFSIPDLNEFLKSIPVSENKKEDSQDAINAKELPIDEDGMAIMEVWTNGENAVNHAVEGWTKTELPIALDFSGNAKEAVYVAVYSRHKQGSAYAIGKGIYVMGFIRVKGKWNGRIAVPKGLEGKDISASPGLKKAANNYFLACRSGGWVGGDTGGFFGKE